MRFSDYFDGSLNEAFMAKDLNTAVGKMCDYLSRKCGKMIFVTAEEVENAKGKFYGMKFVCGGRQIIRFNWTGSSSKEVDSIDIWTENATDPYTPEKHLDVAGISSTIYLPLAAEVLLGRTVDESVEDEGELLLEKECTTESGERYRSIGDAAVTLANRGYTLKEIMEELPFANKAAVQRVLKNAVPTKRGIREKRTSADSKANKKRLDKIQEEPEKYADRHTLEVIMPTMVRSVCRGMNGAIILGAPGQGKTYTVKKVLDEELGKGNYKLVRSKISPIALYTTLFLYNNPNPREVIVFDDCDAVWKDQEMIAIMKGALDTTDRTVSWITKSTYDPDTYQPLPSKVGDTEGLDLTKREDQLEYYRVCDAGPKLPNEIQFNGGIIFISNLRESQLDPAVRNRCQYVDVTLSKDDLRGQILAIPEWTIQVLKGHSMVEEVWKASDKRVKTVLKNLDRVIDNPNFSIRTVTIMMKMYATGLPNWEELALRCA